MTNAVTVTPALAARCGWTDTGQPEVDFGVVAWVTAEALAGSWPCCHRRTDRGKALLLEFPAFLGAHAISLEMAIIVREDKVELLNPEELNHPPRVLLAEDDSDLACVLCALLERAGFKTIHSSDGLEAWHLVQTQPFDIVILDIDLPGLSGIEVCRHIKGMPTLTHLPVVFCSGGHDLDKLTKQAGADGHVEKPAGLSQLVARLNGLLCKPLSLRPSFIKEKNAKHKNEA
jgi:CheY-like chemotaxis protein